MLLGVKPNHLKIFSYAMLGPEPTQNENLFAFKYSPGLQIYLLGPVDTLIAATSEWYFELVQ